MSFDMSKRFKNKEYVNTLQKAVMLYGRKPQELMLFEELAELGKACAKLVRNENHVAMHKPLKDKVEEEIADVQIMLDQFTMMYKLNWLNVNEHMGRKLKRLKMRLDSHLRSPMEETKDETQ